MRILLLSIAAVALAGCGEVNLDQTKVKDAQQKVSQAQAAVEQKAAEAKDLVKKAAEAEASAKELLAKLENQQATVADAMNLIQSRMASAQEGISKTAVPVIEAVQKQHPEKTDELLKIVQAKLETAQGEAAKTWKKLADELAAASATKKEPR